VRYWNWLTNFSLIDIAWDRMGYPWNGAYESGHPPRSNSQRLLHRADCVLYAWKVG